MYTGTHVVSVYRWHESAILIVYIDCLCIDRKSRVITLKKAVFCVTLKISTEGMLVYEGYSESKLRTSFGRRDVSQEKTFVVRLHYPRLVYNYYLKLITFSANRTRKVSALHCILYL